PQTFPDIRLQMFGSVHLYDFNAVIADLRAAEAADPSAYFLQLGDVLQSHEISVSDTDALGGAIAWRYATYGTTAGLTTQQIQEILANPDFGPVAQPILVTGGDTAPVVATPIDDQTVNEAALFNFTVPAGTFFDADVGDTLAYSAGQTNGNPLPAWL